MLLELILVQYITKQNSEYILFDSFFLSDAYENGAYLLTSFSAQQVGNASSKF